MLQSLAENYASVHGPGSLCHIVRYILDILVIFLHQTTINIEQVVATPNVLNLHLAGNAQVGVGVVQIMTLSQISTRLETIYIYIYISNRPPGSPSILIIRWWCYNP